MKETHHGECIGGQNCRLVNNTYIANMEVLHEDAEEHHSHSLVK
jgi:hypothetical protein